jgi:hypothetical protein
VIDFRYHIVSLISVFLALAVGIALGAGPLEATIGTRLTQEVAQLRTEKDELRSQLDAESAVAAERGEYIAAAAEELLAGTLPRRVAVVTLPEVDDDVVSEVVGRLRQAGATVTARLAVTPAWTDPEQQSFRAAIVGTVSEYLETPPGPEASGSAVLGLALAQALTSAAPEDEAVPSGNAGLILEALTSGQLVAVTTAPTAPADAVVVVAPFVEASAEELDGLVELSEAMAAESQGVVVAGPADSGGDLVAALRSGETGRRVATVDHVGGISGQVSLPRALARAVAGEVGHFGFADSADSVLPGRVELAAGTP